jgi:hypothetical protein
LQIFISNIKRKFFTGRKCHSCIYNLKNFEPLSIDTIPRFIKQRNTLLFFYRNIYTVA